MPAREHDTAFKSGAHRGRRVACDTNGARGKADGSEKGAACGKAGASGGCGVRGENAACGTPGARKADGWIRPCFRRFRGRLALCAALGAASTVCATLLMFFAGALVAKSADPATTLFQVMVPVACVQLFALGKPLFRYVARLSSHDLVFRMASELRVRLFSAVAAKSAAWRRSRRFGGLVASFIDDIGHVQDFYLRCVLPICAAAAAALVACLVLGALSWQLGVVAAMFFLLEGCFLPLLALFVDGVRDARAQAAWADACAQMADDVRGAADWAISGRADERVAAYTAGEGGGPATPRANALGAGVGDTRVADAAPPDADVAAGTDAARGEGAQGSSASFAQAHALRERLDAHARARGVVCAFLQAACIAAVLWWAAGAAGGTPAVAAQWAAACAFALFPVAEACAPLSDAALDGARHRRRAERLNALDADETEGAGEVAEKAAAALDMGESCDFNIKKVDNVDIKRGGGGQELSACDAAGQERRAVDAGKAEGTEEAMGEAAAVDVRADVAPPGLRVRGLAFSYGATAPRVFDDFTMDIPAGQHVAVLGRSGCGKSTLLSLLRGAATPDAGRVELVEASGRAVPVCGKLPARNVAVLEQGSYLFSRSVRENLQLACPDADDAALWRALEQAHLADAVRALPDGLDSFVGERGAALSGGQRQRLALARALAAGAPVLLADEPFTALDADLEAALLDTLLAACADKTLVLVTHHLAHIERFDRVVFLEEGRIACDGAPDVLARSDTRFSRLLALERGFLS